MAPPKNSKSSKAAKAREPRAAAAADFSRYPPRPAAEAPEVVDPRWLLKALGITIAVAACFGYLSVCLLVYLGGWQLMLHPSAQVDRTPSVPFQAIAFDAATTGMPRLSGWWIPASDPGGNVPTLLYLHDGSGSLSATVPELELLHQAQVNVFALDYRGFGKSGGPHPTEERMQQDAEAGLTYLEQTRHLENIVPFGSGLGAALAANLADAHPEVQRLIVEAPRPDAFDQATGSGKSRLLPMRLLVQEHFDLGAALGSSKVAKLLIADSPLHAEPALAAGNDRFFRSVPDPKMVVVLGGATPEKSFLDSIARLLHEPR